MWRQRRARASAHSPPAPREGAKRSSKLEPRAAARAPHTPAPREGAKRSSELELRAAAHRATMCGDQKLSVGSQQRAPHARSRLRKGNPPSFPPLPAPLMRGSTVAPRFRTVSSMCVCRNVSAKLRARAGQERERPEPLFEGDFGPNQDRAWLRGSWMDVLSRRAAGNCFLQRAPRSELGQQVPHRRRERKGGSVRTRPCTLLV